MKRTKMIFIIFILLMVVGFTDIVKAEELTQNSINVEESTENTIHVEEEITENMTKTEEVIENSIDAKEMTESITKPTTNTITKTIETGYYTIFCGVGNNQVIDIASGSMDNGANVQTYESNHTNAQIFRLIKNTDGSYEIINKNSGKVLDVQNGNIYNGANVWQYTRNQTNAQKWILEDAGDGYYYIISKLNTKYCLDVTAGNHANGTNIQVYERNYTVSQKFKLEEILPMNSKKTIEDGTYKIVADLDETKVIDVVAGSTKENANIQLYTDNGTDAQKFEIQYGEDGYYTIVNKNSGKPMSTTANNIVAGGNVFQGNQVNSDAQKWIISKSTNGTYSIFSKQSELCLDVSGGNTANGTNICEYTPNGTVSQKFFLIPEENIESTQTLPDGEYNIKTALNESKVIDIENESKNALVHTQIYDANNALSQRFQFEYGEDGYYTITNKNSGKVLDIEYGNVQAGTYVWQYEKNNTNAQKWILKDLGNGYYNIISKLNGLYLTVENSNTFNGVKLEMANQNNQLNQKFKLAQYTYATPEKDVLEDGVYQIILKNGKVFDIDSGSYSNNGNLQIWDNQKIEQQKFVIKQIEHTGYYQIMNVNSAKMLDVSGGAQKISTNVAQYESNGTDSQKWIIKPCGDGYYTITSKCNNLVLDVQGGIANSRNGSNIQVYSSNGTDSQKFRFEKIPMINEGTYEIETILDSSKVLDVAGGGLNDRENVQLYTADNVNQQKFILEYDNGEYVIRAKHSNKVLTVDTNSNNVCQSTYQGLDNQKWTIEPAGNGYYYIVSKYQGLCLDVDRSGTANGTNVQAYAPNKSNAQKFRFFTGFRTFFEEGTYGTSGLKISGDGRGTNLKYYKFGKGTNVLFATFSIHGFEDSYNHDGSELTYIAEQFKNNLHNTTDANLINNWTIYILPNLNPDGQTHGWTNNGPGRNTLYSQAPGNKGIDMNRNWQTESSYTRYYDDRNYNGTAPYQAYEAKALREFLLTHKSAVGQNILVDLHGWLNETIGDEGLGRYYRNQYGLSTHIYSYGKGYLVNWARQSLGNGNRTARSVLVELPQVYSHQEVLNRDFAGKYINATLSMLRENG